MGPDTFGKGARPCPAWLGVDVVGTSSTKGPGRRRPNR
jgi:hypothetical protein